MKAFTIVLLALCILLPACVTEDVGNTARDTSKPGPVEEVQDTVRERIKRIEHTSGNALLRDLQALIAYKELARDPILEVIDEVDARTQANLLYVLGYLNDPAVYPVLGRFLGDSDDIVRYEAAAALVNRGDWSAVPVLIEFMASPDRRMRFKAASALQEATKQDFGYVFNASPPERERAVGMWRSWWEDQRQEMIYGRR